MSGNQSLIVHPMISLIVKQIDRIHDLHEQDLHVSEWRLMLSSLDLLKPRDHQKKTVQQFRDELKQSINYIQEKQGSSPIDTYQKRNQGVHKLMKQKANDYMKTYMQIIWSGNYLSNEGYMEFPAETRSKVVPDVRK